MMLPGDLAALLVAWPMTLAGGAMAGTRGRGKAVRVTFVAALTLAGAGAGVAAALATSGSALIRAAGGAAGG